MSHSHSYGSGLSVTASTDRQTDTFIPCSWEGGLAANALWSEADRTHQTHTLTGVNSLIHNT